MVIFCPTCKQKVILPSDMSKKKVCKTYKAASVQQQLRPLKKGFSSCFLQRMAGPTRQYRHNEACHRLVLRMPTVHDTIVWLASVGEKSVQLQQAEAHLEMIRTERSFIMSRLENVKGHCCIIRDRKRCFEQFTQHRCYTINQDVSTRRFSPAEQRHFRSCFVCGCPGQVAKNCQTKMKHKIS